MEREPREEKEERKEAAWKGDTDPDAVGEGIGIEKGDVWLLWISFLTCTRGRSLSLSRGLRSGATLASLLSLPVVLPASEGGKREGQGGLAVAGGGGG